MSVGPTSECGDASLSVRTIDEVVACFDATGADLFAFCCRLTGGDIVQAELLLSQVFEQLALAVRRGSVDEFDLASLRSTALRVSAIDVDQHVVSGESFRTFERWLDDSIRDHCRSRIRSYDESCRDQSRSRRTVALVAIASLLVALCVAISASPSAQSGQFASSRSSAPSESIHVDDVDGGPGTSASFGYVMSELPDGYRGAGAYEQPAAATSGWFQLWAAPGATRNTGEWLAIATTNEEVSGQFSLVGGHPVDIDGATATQATQATSADGVVSIAVQIEGIGRFTVTGGGLPDGRLREIAGQIAMDGGRFGEDAASTTIRPDWVLLVSGPNSFGNLGVQPVSIRSWNSSYQSVDFGERISISARPTSAHDLEVAKFLLPGSNDSPAARVAGRNVRVGETLLVISSEESFDGKTTHTAQWHDGPNTVTMSGTAGLAVMLAAVSSVRPATTDEWLALSSLPPAYFPA